MRTFLWFMLIVVVSGDEKIDDNVTTVTTSLNKDVLLPCTCMNRKSEKELKWQTERNLPEVVWPNNISTNYKDRVETFFKSDTSNCSILLKNVTEDDHKTYTCRFNDGTYQRLRVILRVCGPKPCLQNLTNEKGLKCDVQSQYKIGLQWTLNGMALENSTKYKISNNSTQTDGFFNVTSTLEYLTETRSSSEIKCIVVHFPEERNAPQHNTESKPGMLIGPVLVIGLIMLVVFIVLRKQMSLSRMEPRCMDIEKMCFWKRASSEDTPSCQCLTDTSHPTHGTCL